MNKQIAKKTIILYVLKILYCATSKTKPVTITSITKILNSMDVPCERRTVGRNVDYIIAFGLPVVKIKGGGVYYDHDADESAPRI